MIYLIVGDNQYRISQEVAKLSRGFDGEVVRIDGGELDVGRLADLVAGATLFADTKMVIIRDLSENRSLWSGFESWLPRVGETTTLVLVERAVDKRLKTYKALKARAAIIEANNWTERQIHDAEEWVDMQARAAKLRLTRAQVSDMVRRATQKNAAGVYHIDQTQLANALVSLAGGEAAVDDEIGAVLPPDSRENVYSLLGTALSGENAALDSMLSHLKSTDDPYKVLGLLQSQWFQFVALSLTDASPQTVAADLGVHPYGVQQLAIYRGRLSPSQIKRATDLLARLDRDLKTTAIEPWHQIERFMIELVSFTKAR